MRLWWLLCAGISLLPGCVMVVKIPETDRVTTPTEETGHDYPPWIIDFNVPVSVNTTVTTTPPAKIVTPNPTPTTTTPSLPQSVTVTPCGIFTLPDLPTRPTRVDLTQPDIQSSEQVEKALTDYIIALEDYLEDREQSLSSSYSRYIERCSPP